MQLQLKNTSRSTAVPNRFIEHCANAPDKYAAAYLTGLMHATNHQPLDLDLFCARLSLTWDEVLAAFEYWQKKGFVRIVNGDTFSLEFGEFSYDTAGDELYTEREFFQHLQQLFAPRTLSANELNKIYDYFNVFGLPKKVVICLVQYCIMLAGKRVSTSYMDKVAMSWAEEEHVDTEEKAQEKITSHTNASSGVKRVLAQLGITSRSPTKDEFALYVKWTHEWGFTLEAILTACANTTKARDPNMKYLDKILQRLHSEGSLSSRQIIEDTTQNDITSSDICELMRIIGETGKPTFEHKSLYRKWTSVFGFGMDMLSAAAKLLAARGRLPFPYLDEILTDWYNNRVSAPEEAQKAITEHKKLDELIYAVFDATGRPCAITDAHRKAYLKWNEEWGIPHEAILLAAEISMLADNPYRSLNWKLGSWHDAGVKTLADAQREAKKFSVKNDSVRKRESYERPVENLDYLALDPFADEGVQH